MPAMRLRRSSAVRIGLVALTLAVLASLLSVIQVATAHAVPGASSPDGDVPLICGDEQVDGLGYPGHAYAAAWIPANSQISFRVTGGFGRGPYHFNTYAGQYNLYVDIYGEGMTSPPRSVGGHWGGGATLHADPIVINDEYLGGWINNTGISQVFLLDLYAVRFLNGLTLDWSLDIEVEGGAIASCSETVDGSELFGPNDALGQQCPPCHGGTSNSVDTRTGNEHFQVPGVSIGGRGPGLDFRAGYNSLDAGYDGAMGRGWRNSFDMALSKERAGVRTVFQETGATVPFTKTSGGLWEAPDRFDATLEEKPSGLWEFVRAREEIFTFREDGRLARIADRNGYETSFVYNNGDLDYVEDEAGRRLDLTWSKGRITKIVDPLASPQGPREIRMTYTDGDLTGYRDIGGGQWTMTYDAQHRLTSARSPRFADATAHPNKVWEFHYDAQGRVDWEEDPQNRRTEIQYDDPAVDATRVVDPNGDSRVDWYDQNGVRTAVTAGYGTPDAATTEFTYDNDTGMLTSTTDGRGKVWTTQYADATNPHRATKTIDPLDRERTMTYNSHGQLLTLTDAEDVTTSWEYDANGNLEKTTTADGTAEEAVTNLVYGDPNYPGDVTKTIDARNKEWAYTYAAATGDRTSATDPLGNKTTWVYNNIGWLTSTVTPKGNVTGATPANFRSTVEYDTYGAPVKTTDAQNHETLIEYDADGNITKITEPDGDISRNTWTAAGQLATTITGANTPTERTVTYNYTLDGQMASWSADPASTWQTTWDPLGRMKTQTDPNGKITRYAYDKNSSLIALTQPGGDCGTIKSKCITYTRDDAGQITSIDFSDAAMGDIDFTHDANGRRLTQEIDGQGTATWEWTAHGQLATQTDTSGQEVAYNWDPTGNLKELTYPGQSEPVVYDYDAAGRMNAVTDWTGNHTAFSYDANSNLTQAAYPTDTGLVDKWAYDNLDRLDTITWDRISDSPLGSIDYTQDADGRLTAATATGVPSSPETFGYDPRNQLKTATNGTGSGNFSYDDRGYLTRTPEGFNTYDPAGQLEDSRRAITVVGTDKAVNALSNTLNLDVPAAIAEDDQIFVIATLKANQSVTTPPAGYTVVAQDSLTNGAKIIVYRKAAAGDETTATVKFSGGTKSAMLIVYRGLDTTNPVATSSTATANDTTTLTVPSLSSPGPGAQLVLATGGTGSLLGVQTTPPATMTAHVAVDNQGGIASSISDETLAAGGATGTRTATFSQTNDAAGVLLALNPETRSYDYDDLGRRTNLTTPADTTTYTYDQVGQLIGIDGPTGTPIDDLDGYTYDGDGLRIQAPIEGQDTHFTWARAPGLPLLLQETAVDANGELDPAKTSNYIYGPGGQVLTRLDPRPDIELVGTDSVAHAGTPTINLALPAGLRTDDQILIGVTHASGITPTIPAGYTEVDTRVNGATTLRFWRRTATGDEGPSLNITFTNSLAAAKAAVVMVYRGVDPIDPIVDLDGVTVQGTSISIPSLDPASAENHVVAFAGSIPGIIGSPSWTPPAGFTEHEDASASSVGLTGIDRDTNTAGATGAITLGFTISSKLAAIGLVLRQAPAIERWHHGDHLGSTRILTDERGRIVGKASYTPYGQIAESTGETSRLGYAGQYTDPDTGLIYLRARYYDPATSQFLTRDPLLQETQDPYGYAANDPVNLSDPTGLCPMCIIAPIAIGALVGGGLDLGFQAAGNLLRGCPALSSINWGSVATSALIGGITGGLEGALLRSAVSGIKSAKSVPLGWNASTRLPSGGSVRDVGARIWGRGTPARDRLDGLTKKERRSLASLEDAIMLNAMYKAAGPGVPNNKTAPLRVELSQKIIDAWRY